MIDADRIGQVLLSLGPAREAGPHRVVARTGRQRRRGGGVGAYRVRVAAREGMPNCARMIGWDAWRGWGAWLVRGQRWCRRWSSGWGRGFWGPGRRAGSSTTRRGNGLTGLWAQTAAVRGCGQISAPGWGGRRLFGWRELAGGRSPGRYAEERSAAGALRGGYALPASRARLGSAATPEPSTTAGRRGACGFPSGGIPLSGQLGIHDRQAGVGRGMPVRAVRAAGPLHPGADRGAPLVPAAALPPRDSHRAGGEAVQRGGAVAAGMHSVRSFDQLAGGGIARRARLDIPLVGPFKDRSRLEITAGPGASWVVRSVIGRGTRRLGGRS